MKTIKYLIIFVLGISTFISCDTIVDDFERSEDYDKGPNIAGFLSKSQNLSAVADGATHDFGIKVEVKGPNREMTDDVLLEVSVDPSSTAIEGVHYIFNSKTITLTASNNYLGILPITVITDGIDPPLATNPKLKLMVSSASGTDVVGNAGTLDMTFVYQCWADLSGTYLVTNDYCAPSFTATITANDDGSWHITCADGGFLHQCTGNSGLVNWGNITELCGEILPTGDLWFGSANGGYDIGDISGGTWDADTGILKMSHTQSLWASPGAWNSTYTRQ